MLDFKNLNSLSFWQSPGCAFGCPLLWVRLDIVPPYLPYMTSCSLSILLTIWISSESWSLHGMFLHWFTSFIQGHFKLVVIGKERSHHWPLQCGVSQGLVLSLLLSRIYMRLLAELIHCMKWGIITDDTQLYISLPGKYLIPVPEGCESLDGEQQSSGEPWQNWTVLLETHWFQDYTIFHSEWGCTTRNLDGTERTCIAVIYASRAAYVTFLLHRLFWLLVCFWVQFKLLVLVLTFKAIHGIGLDYLKSFLCPVILLALSQKRHTTGTIS